VFTFAGRSSVAAQLPAVSLAASRPAVPGRRGTART